jgi:hypothetical protein
VGWMDGHGLSTSGQRDEQSRYKSAAICPNGHVATGDLERSPNLAGKFCKECGLEILLHCPSCTSRIRGRYHIPRVVGMSYSPPNFCEDCGSAFPWITEKLKAARELADELDVPEAEREQIKESLGHITQDKPGTPLATIRLRKNLANATDAVRSALWKMVIDISTEAVKRGLLGG